MKISYLQHTDLKRFLRNVDFEFNFFLSELLCEQVGLDAAGKTTILYKLKLGLHAVLFTR